MIQKLLDKGIYIDEFKKLKHKIKDRALSPDSYNVTETVTAGWTVRNEDFIIKNIIKTLKNKEYQTPIAKEKNVLINEKYRLLYGFDWHEAVLQGAMAKVLSDLYSPIFSNSLQSYRKGRGSHNTLLALSKYLKDIPPDKKVYILRKDIKSYGDSIPHDKLFEILKVTLDEKDYFFEILRKIIGFEYYAFETKKLKTKTIGLPTGSPLNNVITNIFLTDLDKKIDSFVPECCYYRYGDDILVATQNKSIAEQITTILEEMIVSKKLKFSEEKSQSFSFDPISGLNPKFKYLGLMVNPKGNISLTLEKDEELKDEIKSALVKINRMTKKITTNKELSIVTLNKIVKQLFFRTDLSSELLSYFPVVNDEDYWKKLDLWIAKELLAVVYNKSGERVFKKYPFKKLREDGLISLRHIRRLFLYDKSKFRKLIKP